MTYPFFIFNKIEKSNKKEDLQQASQSAQAANVLFNVSEFENVNQATEALVAMSAAYEDAENGLEKMDIVDRLNLIGNNYSIATDGLATALQDSASVLTQSGNDLNQALALITAGNRIVQNPTSVGKGLRTLSLRLTGTKEAAEELEEMGEDTSDMIMSQSKMRELIMNATKVASNNYKGFDIQDELGRYKSTYEILLGLGQIWDEIKQADLKSGDNRQALLLESIAGKNRSNIAASILSSPDVLQSVYEDSSTKSAGSALEENQKYLDSISGHLAKMTNAWQEMWANAANRDVINGFIDLGTKLLELINDAGLLKSAFAVLFGGTIVKGLTNANSLLVKYVQLLTQTKSLSSVLTETFANIFKKLEGWEAIKQAWSNRGQAPATAAPTQPQADTYQPNAYDDAINAQLIGQNAALDENTQKKRENAQAQRELTEATNEGVVSSAASTEQQTAETAANMENAASSQEQAASELDEATAKLENTAATEGLNVAEQQEANVSAEATSANIAQAESEILEATNKMAGESADVFNVLTEAMEGAGDAAIKMGGDVNNGVGHSIGLFSKLGGSLETLKAGFISFITSPSVLMLAIPAAIFAYNKVVGDYNKHQRELIDQAHQASSAWSDTQKSVQDYATKYSDLKSQLENSNLSEAETVDIKKQIYDLQTQITDQYGESASGLDLINGKLEQQLGIIQNISQEEAKRTYGSNREAYERAIGEMNRERNYTINTQGLSQEEMASLFEGIDYEAELDFVTGDETAKTFKNVDQAEKDLNTLNDRLLTIKESMSEGEWAASKYAKVYDDVSKAISANNDVIAENRADAKAGLETQLLMAGDSTGRDLQKNYKAAVDAYNQALITSTDTTKIEEAQKKVQDLQEQVSTFLQGDNAKYSPLFKDIEESINTSLQDTFNLRKQMQSEEGKTAIETAFGKIKENKKNAKEINDGLIETAQNIVDLQKQANEWGVIDNLSPITGTMPNQTLFGNIDLDNRQVLEWTKENKKKFADAWNSYNEAGWNWGEMPEIGDMSTVLGGSAEFQGIEIAFSPILQGEDGEPQLLSHDSLTTYLDAVVHSATDKNTGKVNLDEIIKIDGDPKRGGKKLIAAVGKAGDQAVMKLGQSMHFMGRDGALTSGMRDLAHMAREANVPITQIMQSLQQNGGTSGLEAMLQNTVVSAGDVQNALMGADDAISLILSDLAQQFGITMETPDDQIQAFINELATMGLVAADSAQASQSSLDHFFKDTSSKIEKITSLTSVLQKGQSQTGLTFTKTLDDQGNQVASEVKSIIDAYKGLEGYDLGSLFEETGTGIKLNMDAYRALAQEEEAETKRQYKLQRAALENQLATASPEQQEKIKQQITELDMLSSAYDGATSALAKYLNQQNAADYGDTYSMLQGTTIKRGDELLNKGLIGTEEFRSIAQLFSFKSLATEDAQGVAEAYKTGVANVRKYFTEDAVQGVFQFATDIEQLPEKFGNIARDADGAFTFDLTDEQLNNLAEHFEVSTDVIEAFFDQIRATGGEIHLWRDGGFEDFKQLDDNIDASKEKLKQLKEVSNDPNLVSKLDFDAGDIDTIDEIKQKIEDFKDIKAKLPVDSEEAKEAQKIIDDLEAKLQKYEEAAENARNTSPITVESYQEANDMVNQINDGLAQMQQLEDQNIKVSVTGENGTTGSQMLQDLATQISMLPDTLQEYVMVEAGMEWQPGMTPEDIMGQMQGKFETTPIIANVDADTTSADTKTDNLVSKMAAPIVGLFTVEAEASEVEEVREEAEEPMEAPLTIKPTNTVQEAANQAGAGQGVTTEEHKNTQVTETHDVVYTANTSGLDNANNAVNAMNGQIVNVTINVTGQDKVESANKQITSLVNKAKTKINVTINGNATAFNKAYTDANNKLTQLGSKETVPKIKADNSNLKDKVEDSKRALNSIDNKKVTITAVQAGDFGSIANWKKNTYDQLKDKEIKIKTTYTSSGKQPKTGGGGGYQGTAHYSGTVLSHGKAFASGSNGNWGLKQDEEGALINELGGEVIVTPDGRWQILNNGYPTFANLEKGTIVFNHKQTEELLENGRIKGTHGKLVGGAFATGTTGWTGAMSGTAHAGTGKWKAPTTNTSNNSGNRNSGSRNRNSGGGKHSGGNNGGNHSSSSNKAAKDFLQTLDAIEIQLQRVDAEISRLDTNANKTYTSFSSRSSSIKKELKTVNKEIEKVNKSLLGKGFQGTAANPANYFKKALQASKAAGSKKDEGGSEKKHNRPGDDLTKYWTDRIKNAVDQGALLTIDDVHDEGLWKKIQAYQTWYEKGVKLKQKQQEYLNKLNTLTIQHLQLTQKSYESAINLITEDLNYNQQMMEAQQRFLKNDTIHFLNSNIKKDIAKRDKLQKEADELQAELNQAIKDGYITKDSEEYNTWTANIKKIKNDIIATENDMVNQTVAKMDYVQERWQSVLDMIDAEVEGYNTQIESRAYKQRIPKKLTPTKTKNDATLNDYNNIMIKDQQSINRLKKERKDIQKYLNEALRKSTDKGGIQKDSAIWREQQKRLKEIDNEIGSKTNDIVEQIINQLEHITDKWDAVLDHIESRIDNIQARQDIRTEKGYAASENYYRQEIAQQKQRRNVQARQRNDLVAFLKKNLNVQTKLDKNGDLVPVTDKKGKTKAKPGGKIAYGSKDYYEWMTKIQEATGDLLEIDKTLVKLNNDIRQLRWDAFDRAQEKIKSAAEEADFFNGLIYENKLFNENGQMTTEGRMSQGLITQQYDLYMKDAQQYGRMVKALNKQINKDPNNLDLIEQRDKWLEAQRQSIENAHKQKEAIRDLVEKGIKKQIEAMSKLIKKYEESLDAQRAQDQYAKSIADKQKRINSLQKQLKAMGGDDSEEGATKRQQLRDELKNAQQDLEDTQEDKRIADIKEALSNMQERYEEVLNARLEDIEGLFAEAIQTTDANGAKIVDSIEKLAKSVGYDLSNELSKASTDFVKALQGVKNVSDENKAGALVSNTNSNGKFNNSAATTVKKTTDSLPKEGTYTENGKKAFYFKGTKVKTGWNTIEGKKYYFNKDNTRLTGRQTIGNKDYYFGTDGALQVGTFKIGSTTYTTNKNGVITKKEKHTSDPTPAKKTATPAKKSTTPTKKTPAKKTPAKETPVKKKQASDRAPAKKTTATTTTTKKKTPGANYTGLWKDGSSTYYYVKGKKQTGWKDMKEGRRYFSTSGGKMLTGAQLISGKTYLLDSSTGVLKSGYTGLYTQGKYKYYFVKGVAATGWQSMKEGKRYFSTVNGRMLTGLQKIGNASYYLDPKTGVIKTGSFTVGSIKYEADKNGKITKKNGTTVKGALAKGTANVNRAGMYRVDEEGNEVFINKNGKIYTRLDKGTTVLPHDAAINLLKGMSNPVEFIKSHMDMRPNKNITTHNTSDNVENHITFNLPNVTSYKEFMREAQKDPNFTKYIQEISLGRLNGNNSLKGNSIRFK